ncbi:hypothetical protein HMPREF1549_02106 [Actinomyces johnsonii F0510]|uniref:Uncharacterized protein n=1 Tax=Actinomyces johnsonii F0510 TaxID=1227262 RepID=U1Q7E7_9ACTO|nr:hypothetical protein HMPREF1549_02106 [Actinomyces johnsonii F0510]
MRVRRVAFTSRTDIASSPCGRDRDGTINTLTPCQGDSALSGEMPLLWQP